MDGDSTKEKIGLKSKNRNLITCSVFVVLFLFGQLDLYVIFISVLIIFLILKYFGKCWKMDNLQNDYLNRAIFACIAGALLVSVYLSITTKYHTECDQYIQTRDGRECVGDYIIVRGPDKEGAFIKVIFASIAMWYAVSKRNKSDL